MNSYFNKFAYKGEGSEVAVGKDCAVKGNCFCKIGEA